MYAFRVLSATVAVAPRCPTHHQSNCSDTTPTALGTLNGLWVTFTDATVAVTFYHGPEDAMLAAILLLTTCFPMACMTQFDATK